MNDVFSSNDLAGQLANATVLLTKCGDRSEHLGYSILERILRVEITRDARRSAHVQDVPFTEKIMEAANMLLRCSNEHRQLALIALLVRYGRKLSRFHQELPYLHPFQAITENWGGSFE